MDSSKKGCRRTVFFPQTDPISALRLVYERQDGHVLNSAMSTTKTTVNSMKMSITRDRTNIISDSNYSNVLPPPQLNKDDVKFMAQETTDICKQLHYPNQLDKSSFIHPPGRKFYTDIFFFLASALDESVITLAKESAKSDKKEWQLPCAQLDFMIKFLSALGFPHKINKSYLISVNSIHSWPFLLFMLYWLATVVLYYGKLDRTCFFVKLRNDSNDDKAAIIDQIRILEQMFHAYHTGDNNDFDRLVRQAYEMERGIGNSYERMKQESQCLKIRIQKFKERPQKLCNAVAKFEETVQEAHSIFLNKQQLKKAYNELTEEENKIAGFLDSRKAKIKELEEAISKMELQRHKQSEWSEQKIENLLNKRSSLNNEYDNLMFRQQRIIRELETEKQESTRVKTLIKECIDDYNSDISQIPNAEIFRNLYLPSFNVSDVLNKKSDIPNIEKMLQILSDIRNSLQVERSEGQRTCFNLKLTVGDLEKKSRQQISDLQQLEKEVNKLLKHNDEIWAVNNQINRQAKLRRTELKEELIANRLTACNLCEKNRVLKVQRAEQKILLDNVRGDYNSKKTSLMSYISAVKEKLASRGMRRRNFANTCELLMDKYMCTAETDEAEVAAVLNRIESLEKTALIDISTILEDLDRPAEKK